MSNHIKFSVVYGASQTAGVRKSQRLLSKVNVTRDYKRFRTTF